MGLWGLATGCLPDAISSAWITILIHIIPRVLSVSGMGDQDRRTRDFTHRHLAVAEQWFEVRR